MPEAAKNYSITELEMCRLAMNIATFSHLLKKVDFDAVVDHLAITHIMRSKAEPATTRIKRLLELLSPYSFNLYYIKGKDMVLSDFLSRQKTDNSNPHELIPILFTLRNQETIVSIKLIAELITPKQIFSTDKVTSKIQWHQSTGNTSCKQRSRSTCSAWKTKATTNTTYS